MLSAPRPIDVKQLPQQKGNTCGAHSIYNYLVLTGHQEFTTDLRVQEGIIKNTYRQIIMKDVAGEAALPDKMLKFFKDRDLSMKLYGSKKFQTNLEELRDVLSITDPIYYFDDPFTQLGSDQYGIALWNATEEFPEPDELATMHYTVVYKNAEGGIQVLDSNRPQEGWLLADKHEFGLNFMGLLFAC